MRRALKWLLLVAATVGVTVPLTLVNVPSAALFAALAVGIALALTSLAPARIPRRAGVAAQGVLGVYIGTMVQHGLERRFAALVHPDDLHGRPSRYRCRVGPTSATSSAAGRSASAGSRSR